MKKVIELNEKDIQMVMAKTFNCDPTHVLISVTEECSGYGPFESPVKKVKVIIRQEGSVC